MYIKIRGDLFHAAIKAAARIDSTELGIKTSIPDSGYETIPSFVIGMHVPEINDLLMNYIAVGGKEPDPAEAFFSIDPPGLWMRLRELIGPGSHHEGPMKDFLESNEALVITVNEFLEVLEMTQDIAYEQRAQAKVGPRLLLNQAYWEKESLY